MIPLTGTVDSSTSGSIASQLRNFITGVSSAGAVSRLGGFLTTINPAKT